VDSKPHLNNDNVLPANTDCALFPDFSVPSSNSLRTLVRIGLASAAHRQLSITEPAQSREIGVPPRLPASPFENRAYLLRKGEHRHKSQAHAGICDLDVSDVPALGDAEPQNSSRNAIHNIHTHCREFTRNPASAGVNMFGRRSYHTHGVWTHSVQQPMMKRAIQSRSAGPIRAKAASIAR
jgi:hypothetical protein